MSNDLYGLVKKHPAGPLHLVAGRAMEALCGAKANPREGWAVTMRGLITASWAVSEAGSEGICHNCRKALA